MCARARETLSAPDPQRRPHAQNRGALLAPSIAAYYLRFQSARIFWSYDPNTDAGTQLKPNAVPVHHGASAMVKAEQQNSRAPF
jgi:hypothetical protein